MACAEEIRKRLRDLENIRSLAKRIARSERSMYVIIKKNDTYDFCKYGEENGDILEFIHYL